MHRFKRASGLLALAGAAAAAACSDPLDVDNRNNPDRGSVLNLPRDVEALSSNLYQNLHAAQFGSSTAVYPQLLVVSFENASSLNNFAMGPRSGIPRPFLDNSPGNSFILENYREFQRGRTARARRRRSSSASTTRASRSAAPPTTRACAPSPGSATASTSGSSRWCTTRRRSRARATARTRRRSWATTR
jgi:hypothetical protein